MVHMYGSDMDIRLLHELIETTQLNTANPREVRLSLGKSSLMPHVLLSADVHIPYFS